MAQIESRSQFLREIAVPLWTTVMLGAAVAPVAGVVLRHFIVYSRWPARTLMYLTCMVAGGVSTWLGHAYTSVPVANFVVLRLRVTRLGYIFPYLFCPFLAYAVMFLAQSCLLEGPVPTD